MSEGQPYMYSLNFKIKEGYTGSVFVAQCKEFPAIIVQGKTMSEIKKKAQDALTGYLIAFPEKKKEFLKYSTPVKSAQQKYFKTLTEKIDEYLKYFEKLPQKENNWKQVELLTIKR
jgi:predicted RNase H-like HicB family nuclease